jgi:tetratricopeptide (TPR) repeat protein
MSYKLRSALVFLVVFTCLGVSTVFAGNLPTLSEDDKARLRAEELIRREVQMTVMPPLLPLLISNSALFLFVLTVLALLIGKTCYGISPWQYFKEIKHKQDQYKKEDKNEEFKKSIVEQHLQLGNTFLDIRQVKAAKAEFEAALKLEPTNIDARQGLFKSEIFEPIQEEYYDPEIMKIKLTTILKNNSQDKHALLFLGRIYTDIDNAKALEYLRNVLSQDSKLAVAHNNMGFIYDKQNNIEGAFKSYEEAAKSSEWNTFIVNNLAYHYLLR